MTIVIGYTPSPHSQAALTRAIALAVESRQRVVVVNASPGNSYTDASFASAAEMAEVEGQLQGAGVDHEIRQPVRGMDGAEEVLAVADEVGATTIVIGMRRRSPVGKLLLGSAAQTILLRADCDVLAVKR